MGLLHRVANRIATSLDAVDGRVDKPAKASGTYLQGSEQMIDSDMAKEIGRATSNKRSGFGRGV